MPLPRPLSPLIGRTQQPKEVKKLEAMMMADARGPERPIDSVPGDNHGRDHIRLAGHTLDEDDLYFIQGIENGAPGDRIPSHQNATSMITTIMTTKKGMTLTIKLVDMAQPVSFRGSLTMWTIPALPTIRKTRRKMKAQLRHGGRKKRLIAQE